MASSLTWLDHDSAERERMNRVLALFQERTTVDELGLGGVRDSIADLLFPGTSTIQTRLRYFLFVPWIYRMLEDRFTPTAHIAKRARDVELRLVQPLLDSADEREAGIFGRLAGGGLKRLPSAVYWNGLGSWGIRVFNGSQDQYHRAIDEIYRRRRNATAHEEPEARERALLTWHPALPPIPDGFPDEADIVVTREEAEFVLDRIRTSHGDTFLRVLADLPALPEAEFPWELSDLPGASHEHRELLHHGRMFSVVRQGAAILYNLMLAEEAGNDELIEEHREQLHAWVEEEIDVDQVRSWDLGDFWRATAHPSHYLSATARSFFERWVAEVRVNPGEIADRRSARDLVRLREMTLKGPRSRFRNIRSREEKWGGYSGLVRTDYRWYQVRRLLDDLHSGIGS